MTGICKGRTVIITGAGGGLGRAYALAFAAEGANVVVNDIRLDAAQAVVDEVRGAGGRALADSGDITTLAGAQAIVDAAVAAFGEVHVPVDHPRIINTSSGAGLQGSIGQSNYAAAKAGIAGLTLVQAAELARYGITVNCLAPAARTSMTEGAMPELVKKPEAGFDVWDPLNVAAIVVWLGSPLSASVTGRCFEAKGGELSVADGWRTGTIIDKGARWDPAELSTVVQRLIDEGVAPQKVYGT